jgi:hypothetical protein
LIEEQKWGRGLAAQLLDERAGDAVNGIARKLVGPNAYAPRVDLVKSAVKVHARTFRHSIRTDGNLGCFANW